MKQNVIYEFLCTKEKCRKGKEKNRKIYCCVTIPNKQLLNGLMFSVE